MSSDKIRAWEVLLADAIGEDAAIRILYDTAVKPLRWFSGRPDKSAPDQTQRDPPKP
jgi:hypothetical protein